MSGGRLKVTYTSRKGAGKFGRRWGECVYMCFSAHLSEDPGDQFHSLLDLISTFEIYVASLVTPNQTYTGLSWDEKAKIV
jgi:hypothetical protein